jgi:hypothetical protein
MRSLYILPDSLLEICAAEQKGAADRHAMVPFAKRRHLEAIERPQPECRNFSSELSSS